MHTVFYILQDILIVMACLYSTDIRHCMALYDDTSDSFSTMALYESIYLLSYLQLIQQQAAFQNVTVTLKCNVI